MKALIVDPDRTARSVVKRLLSHINVEVVEADNGLVALSTIEQADPDFVILEVDMPILSGYDCLAAIRQSPVRSDIPVVCITATGTREAVMKMVALGVSDFLLKPIHPVEVLPRIKSLLVRVSQWRQRNSSKAVNSLLMVDHDQEFLAFAKPLLEQSFEVLDVSASTAAAMGFQDANPRPTVVCLAEGLPLMNEDMLMDVISKMAIESGTNPPLFFLLSRSGEVPPEKAARYAGVVRKSSDPQGFLEEFARVVQREQNPLDRLSRLVRSELRSEVVAATQQTLGAMISSEILEIPADEATEVPNEDQAQITLLHTASGVAMEIVISSGRHDLEAIGSLILRREITFEEGASDVLGELVNTISGRIRTHLMSRGLELELGLPQVRTHGDRDASTSEPDLEAKFRCSTGEVFRVAVRVVAGEGRPVASAIPASEPATVGVGEAAQAADDVLF